MSISYAREQLGNAVFAALATGEGRIQERLVDAWADLIHINEERDLPEDLRPRWQIIRALATLEPGSAGQGALRTTILRMDDESAVEIARHIVDFHRLIAALP